MPKFYIPISSGLIYLLGWDFYMLTRSSQSTNSFPKILWLLYLVLLCSQDSFSFPISPSFLFCSVLRIRIQIIIYKLKVNTEMHCTWDLMSENKSQNKNELQRYPMGKSLLYWSIISQLEMCRHCASLNYESFYHFPWLIQLECFWHLQSSSHLLLSSRGTLLMKK